MTKNRSTKRALLMSALALVMCVSMLIGSTFAWFTDSVTSAGNTIQSGNLRVDLVDKDGNSLEGRTLEFVDENDVVLSNILWEPGCTYTLEDVFVKNKGNLALKYYIVVSGTVGDAKLLEAIDWTIVFNNQETDLDNLTGRLAAGATSSALSIKGHMKEEAGNEYQDLTLAGISITVYATQDTVEADSFGSDYDLSAAVYVKNTAEAQAALDNATKNTVIVLAPYVNYGTLYLRPSTNTDVTKVVDWLGNNYVYETYSLFEDIVILGSKGSVVDALEIEGVTCYQGGNTHSQVDIYPTMLSLIELRNVTIDGVTFTGNGGQYGDSHGNAISVAGNNIKVDGLTIKNCVLEDPTHNNRILYKSEATTVVHNFVYDGETYTLSPTLKDITVTGCTFNGGYQGLELRETENLTITNNTFNGVAARDILLTTNDGCEFSGTITIKNNTSYEAKDRFVRAAGIGDATVIITDNNVIDYMAPNNKDNYIFVEGATGVVTIENNTMSRKYVVADAAELKNCLANAKAGTTIYLAPANYGTLVFNQNADSKVVDITTAGGDAAGNEHYSKYENITIIGTPGAIVDQINFNVGWIAGSGASFVDIKNLTIKDVTFSGAKSAIWLDGSMGSHLGIDGLTIENCKMADDGNDRFVFQQITGYKQLNDKTTGEYVMTAGIKNLTITGCEVEGAYQVIESRAMENLTITNNTFKGIKERDMLITYDTTNHPGVTYTGTITITGNTSINGEERFIRGAGIGNATLIIKDNTINNYKGADDNYIKVEGATGTKDVSGNVATPADASRTLTIVY